MSDAAHRQTSRSSDCRADFDRWDDLLALILRSFAYMDGVIDPPSSARRLTPDRCATRRGARSAFSRTAGDRLAGLRLRRRDAPTISISASWRSIRLCRAGHRTRACLRRSKAHALRAGKPVLELQTRVELDGQPRRLRAARLRRDRRAPRIRASTGRPRSPCGRRSREPGLTDRGAARSPPAATATARQWRCASSPKARACSARRA